MGETPPADDSDPSVGLDEVERALSLLGGRHPEHQRTRRELDEAARARRRESERVVARDVGRRRTFALVLAVNLSAVAFAGWVGFKVWHRNRVIREALDPIVAPWLSAGFERAAASDSAEEHSVTGASDGPSCFVAVRTGGSGLSITHGASSEKASSSAGWCTCGSEPFAVQTTDARDRDAWVEVLRIDARKTGGGLARSYADVTPETWLEGGAECAEELFDAWLRSLPPSPIPESVRAHLPPAGSLLVRGGFSLIAASAAPREFVIASPEASACQVALAASPNSFLHLRREGGERPVRAANGALVWCASRQERWAVFGEPPIVVFSAPADRVGGLQGASERAAQAGAPQALAWIPPSDLEMTAKAALAASGATPFNSGVASPSARLVAFALEDAVTLSVPSNEDSFHYCTPPLESRPMHGVCVESAAERWGAAGSGAIASAPAPFWLSLFSDQPDPDMVRAELAVMRTARALNALGFEPTVNDGIGETAQSVTVAGRAGDDGVAVVGIARTRPWVWTYSNGRPWGLDGEPVITKLRPFERVTLVSALASDIPKAERRVIVFRRRAL